MLKHRVINNTKVLQTTIQPEISKTYVTTYKTIYENNETV